MCLYLNVNACVCVYVCVFVLVFILLKTVDIFFVRRPIKN